MNIVIKVLPLLLSFLGTVAFAANDECLDKAASQAQIDACMSAGFTEADAELNRVYNDVRRKYADDEAFLGKFKLAQRAWIAYRDAELEARYPATDKADEYGSSYQGCAADVKTELTRARTIQLKRWLNGVAEGDVCAGSMRAGGDAPR
jgi:uncharacterized protein YecT (DUF1311 family)